MRKGFKRTAALALAVGMLLGMSLSSYATTIDRSYTYNYDYWGDVQESPDVYSVARVFTYTDLGMDKNITNAESLFVYKDRVYVCDTGNNRIVILKRIGTGATSAVFLATHWRRSYLSSLYPPTSRRILYL